MGNLIDEVLGRRTARSGDLNALAGAVRVVSSGTAEAGASEQFAKLASQMAALNATTVAQSARVLENTRALGQNTASRGPSIAGEAARAAAGIGGSGLFLSPLLTGLMRLFGGGKRNEAPPALVSYAKPEAIHAAAGLDRENRATAVAYEQGNAPRAVPSAPASITVQVNAMDSRSFLDHRDDIARAVRSALLESHALGDVIREL